MNTAQIKTSDIRLRVKKFIRATPERVFAAWTQPALMKQWFCPATMGVAEAASDPRVGGSYRIRMTGGECGDHPVVGRYMEVVPNRKLVFTWNKGGDESAPETLVTVEFREIEGGTEVSLLHERFATEALRDGHEKGWTACLDHLGAWADSAGRRGPLGGA